MFFSVKKGKFACVNVKEKGEFALCMLSVQNN